MFTAVNRRLPHRRLVAEGGGWRLATALGRAIVSSTDELTGVSSTLLPPYSSRPTL